MSQINNAGERSVDPVWQTLHRHREIGIRREIF
ncbi:hypothetical protein ABH911_003415 [Pseudomonas protegens]